MKLPSLLFRLTAIASALCVACTQISVSSVKSISNSWTVPGELRIGVRQEPDTLNPVLGQQQIDIDISMFLAGYLLTVDDHNQFVPELAAEVPTLRNGGISVDGKTITYHLRPGVHWQDDAPFTAADVIFSWQAVMNPRNLTPSRVGYELIRGIEARGNTTLIVHLVRPYAPFVSTFFASMAAYPYCVLPRHLLAQYADLNRVPFNLMPVGTGPFRVDRYEPDNLVRLVANPLYWRGRPSLKEVVFRVIPNDNTLATLTQTHEIDFYYRTPHFITRTLRGLQGMSVISSPFTRFDDIGFNTRSELVSDVRVRQALAYATDRQALVDKVTVGADVVADSDQPAFLWAHNAHVFRYSYNPARAAQLLEAAGWHVGADGIRRKGELTLQLGFAGAAGDAVVAIARQVLQSQWRQVGVATEIKSYPSDILFAPLASGGIEMSGRYDVVFESFSNGADPDDSILFECRWQPPQGENVYRFCDSELDTAEELALVSNDRAARKAAYDHVQDILAKQLPIFPLWFERYDYVFNANLRNFRPAHVGSPFWNAWQWQI